MRLLIRSFDRTAGGRSRVGIGSRFGKILVSEEGESGEARSDGIVAQAHGRWMAVAQKGRSFQRANPEARVLVDAGRYLLIDWAEPHQWVEEPGCFAVVPYASGVINFGLRGGVRRAPRADVTAVVNSFSADDLRQQVEQFAAIHTRESTGAGFLQALEMCEQALRDAGCEISRQSFAVKNGVSHNLIGYRRGSYPQAKILIIGAHLDSVNHEDGDGSRAPGADDNATGAVTVLQAAAALSMLPNLAHDVLFVLFGGEEQGLVGSRHFVQTLALQDRSRVAGMVNIDMAGSMNTERPTVLLEGARLSQMLIDQLASAAATYTQLETQVSLNPYASDHVPFIEAGIPALLTIEGADGAYAHEHTARDVTERLDFELHRQITMMDVAWLATSALPAEAMAR